MTSPVLGRGATGWRELGTRTPCRTGRIPRPRRTRRVARRPVFAGLVFAPTSTHAPKLPKSRRACALLTSGGPTLWTPNPVTLLHRLAAVARHARLDGTGVYTLGLRPPAIASTSPRAIERSTPFADDGRPRRSGAMPPPLIDATSDLPTGPRPRQSRFTAFYKRTGKTLWRAKGTESSTPADDDRSGGAASS